MKTRIISIKLTETNTFIGMDTKGNWFLLDPNCTMILYRLRDRELIDTAWQVPAHTAQILLKNLNQGIYVI